jgi:hypothetical protein
MDRQSEERRCVELDGRKACVSLENGDTAKDDLSAVLRVFVLTHFRQHFGGLTTKDSAPAVAEDGVPYRMTEKRQIH